MLEGNKPYLLRIIDGQVHTSKEFGATNVEIAASGTDKIDDNGQKVPQQNPTSTLYNNNVNGTLKPQSYQAPSLIRNSSSWVAPNGLTTAWLSISILGC